MRNKFGWFLVAIPIVTLWVGLVSAQIDHKRGHFTVKGELQAHYRMQPEFAPDLRPVFWVNDVTIVVPPGSDLEKFFLAKVGTRIEVTVKPE